MRKFETILVFCCNNERMHQTDEAIVAAVQQGETNEFKTLLERYEAKISRYGRRFLSDPEDIADLVQGIFIKAYVNIKSFDTQRRFSPWIYRIAHNEFVNALKKHKREPFFVFETDTIFPKLASKEHSDDNLMNSDLRATMDKCLKAINTKYQEVLILFFYEELSYQDIADVLHIPISTVGVRIKRAKEELKKKYVELN